jgi:hypothetical protein
VRYFTCELGLVSVLEDARKEQAMISSQDCREESSRCTVLNAGSEHGGQTRQTRVSQGRAGVWQAIVGLR